MRGFLAALFVLVVPGFAGADDIVKRSLAAVGGRTYYLYVPPDPKPGEQFPVIITLHGSGRDGKSLVEKWRPLAKSARIVLAGPDAIRREGWAVPGDGPDALYFLIEEIGNQVAIDKQRLYLFGHSAGAIFGLSIGLLESEYFAAVSIHAGVLHEPGADPLLRGAARKIPMQIQIGTEDRQFPLARVRASRDLLQQAGFPIDYVEIARHTHAYYDRAAAINQTSWAFLSSHRLPGEPKYNVYGMK